MRRIPWLALSFIALTAQAATYRWVDADGRVSYGDRPPAEGAAAVQSAGVAGAGAGAPSDTAALPYPVRAAATRFPVRLYTSRNCAPCELARTHLTRRGVPFAERVVSSADDFAAFRRLGFAEPQTPALSVGSERAQGFGADAWNLLLDAAGYPRTSMLPQGWRPAAAEPLAGPGVPGAAPAAPATAGASRDARQANPSAPAQTAARADAAAARADSVPEFPYAKPTAAPRPAPPAAKSGAEASVSTIRF